MAMKPSITTPPAPPNLASGAQALFANTSGFYNMANGAFALVHNITGNYNVGEGLDALFNSSRGNAGAGDSQCRATKINHCPAGKSDCCVSANTWKEWTPKSP